MNKSFKRVLLLLAVVCMFCALFAVAAVAETTGTCVHDWEEQGGSLLPGSSCTKVGIYKIQCSKCLAVDYIQRLGHEYSKVASTIDATCENPQMWVYKCKNYSECKSYIYIRDYSDSKPLEHKLDGVSRLKTERKDATCEDPACMLTYCTIEGCDYRVVEPLTGDEAASPLGHIRYTSLKAQAPTCEDEGWTVEISCLREGCGKVLLESEDLPADPEAHKPVAVCPSIEPDCEKQTNGVGYYECEYCEAKLSDTVVIPWAHDYIDVIDEEYASCVKDGWLKVRCSVCEDVKLEVKPATGEHVYVLDTIPATCETNALFGKFCACGAVDGDMEEIPDTALGHDEEINIYETATCQHPAGIVITCGNEDCDYIKIMDYEGIAAKPALEHKPKPVDDKVATCAERGLIGKVVCGYEGCDHVINPGVVTPKDPTKHVWEDDEDLTADDIKVAPNCKTGEAGYGTFTCKLCTETKEDFIKPEAGHKWGAYTKISDATCEEDGEGFYTCTVCGDTKDYGYEATGHNFSEFTYRQANCELPYRKVEKCSKCSAIGETLEELPQYGEAKGHDFDDENCEVTRFDEATCEYPVGVLTKCIRCDKTVFEPDVEGAEGLGHDPETVPTKYATCEEEGLKGKVVCARCEDVLEEGEVLPIDEDAHVPYRAEILNPSDCITMTPGFGVYRCQYCEVIVDYGTFEATHTKPEESKIKTIKEANCLEEGKIEYTCTVCKKIITEVTEVDEDAHVIKEYTGNGILNMYWPDCEAGIGYYGEMCIICGDGFEEMSEYTSYTKGHIWNSTRVEATCEQVAGYEVKCKLCGESEFHPDDDSAVAAHTPYPVADKAATCSAPGWTNKVICSVCSTEEEETILSITWIDIDVDAHTPEVQYELENRKADCLTQTDGYAKFWCKDCHTHITYGETPYEVYGHKELTVEDVAATCVEDGSKVVVCEKCQLTLVNEVRPATGIHDWKEEEVGKAADCENPARVVIECKNCPAVKDVKYVSGSEALGHEWEGEFKDADCENPARIVYTCTNEGCPVGEKVEIVTGALAEEAWGHKEISGDVAATCQSKGYTGGRIVCERCPAVIVEGIEVPVNPNNHVLSDTPIPGTEEEGITCTKSGKASFKCTLCNYVTIADYILDHDWGTLQVKDDYSYTFYECDDCGAELIDEWLIPHCDHEALPAVEENREEATCTVDGSYDLVVRCLFCKEVIETEHKIIDAPGHTEKEVAAVAPTCTETGLTAGTVCEVCNEPVKAQEVVDALGHTEEDLAAVAATCTETGLTAGKKCIVCDKITVEQKVVEALGHTEVEIPAVAATCTVDGLTAGKKCSVCGEETVKQEAVKAAGHTEEVIAGKAATCTEAGLSDGAKCSVCGETVKAQVEIAALGHNYVAVEGKPATCTEAGLTAGKQCANCGDVVEAQVEIPALGHSFVVSWDFNEDFTKKVQTSTCSVCGHVTHKEFDF